MYEALSKLKKRKFTINKTPMQSWERVLKNSKIYTWTLEWTWTRTRLRASAGFVKKVALFYSFHSTCEIKIRNKHNINTR